MNIGNTHSASVIEAAERLRKAAESRVPCEPVRTLFGHADVEAGYAVQETNTKIAIDSGRRLVGRKIGLTSKSVQKQLGVDQPDYGMLFADMAIADAEEMDPQSILQPKVEAEIALVLDRDLTMEHPTIADVIRATAFALPSIEVVGSRIRNWEIRLVDTVADNASSGLFILGGSPVTLSNIDLVNCRMAMHRGEELVSEGRGAACLGNPLVAAVWLARKMVEVGRPLQAGDIVMTGALGPMVPVQPGDRFDANIEGIGRVRAFFGEADVGNR